MFGLFGMFGRSRELRRLDAALRDADLHPALVPEAVKLAAVRLLWDEAEVGPAAYAEAATLLAYCMLGETAFEEANGAASARAVESRVEAALDDGNGPDARLVLLALHAGVIQPSVVTRFDLRSEPHAAPE